MMKKTNNYIAAKTALHLWQLYFSAQILLVITVILVIYAHPCRANMVKAHTHKFKVVSVNCQAGTQTLKCKCNKTKIVHIKKGHHFRKTKDGLYTVNKCLSCGKVSKMYLSKNIPTFWDRHIDKALKTAKKHGDLPGYVFLTDPHWNNNAGHSPAIVSYVTKQMKYPCAICGGDVVTGSHANRADAVKEIKDFYNKFTVPVLSVIGNHDANKNDNPDKSAHLSNYDINRLMHAHTPPGTHTSNDGKFAFLDDVKHRVRYITFYFDESSPVSADVISSIDKGVSELDDRWYVVLYSHAYWHYAHPGDAPYARSDAKQLADVLLDVQARSQATIVLWHIGHIHRDKSEVLSDGNGNQILVVSTNCDAYQKSACWGGLDMTKGTPTEQVIDIVQIDKAAGKIYMTRIGAGSSRTFDILRDIS